MSFLDRLAALWRRSPAAPATHAEPAIAAPPLTAKDRDALVRTLYGEARGESDAGQIAVVHVIRNRVLHRKSSAFVECHRPRQFSCWNLDDPNYTKIIQFSEFSQDYTKLGKVVDRAWDAPDVVHGARHYFASSMIPGPYWAKAPGREVAVIGGHRFWAGVA